ncbi:MAG: amino acid ABC transporter permease [Proteobacteria bacterium]|jgi:glutamate/aspartate transport system permease protein|nr:amino acid ABC transporter permease [Pseudomonadota bacterium]NCV23974.1 amino acid ABC transporter permease [Pseudomonadota bacterium]NCW79498.1 amino acid ABC transporter permease [Pelagibacteraceae bacterium]
MKYNWNWSVLFEQQYFDWIVSGTLWTIYLSLAASVIAFFLGSLIGILRTLDNKILNFIGTTYVEIFRNIPLLVQMFIWYFVFPELVPKEFGNWLKQDLPNPEFSSALFCLGTYTASRVAEQVRSGINSVSTGVGSAGYATGLTTYQLYIYVLLPIAYRIIIPPLTSEFLTIFKNSSLALTIGLMELTARSNMIMDWTFQGFEAFTAATVIYVSVTMIVTLIMQRVESKTQIPGFIRQKT